MDTQSYKTTHVNAASADRKWWVVDASQAPLGRLSSNVARVLRGKHKPSFTPNVDCGDDVIVINAENLMFKGPLEKKEYLRHTGHPGGQRIETAAQLLDRKPELLIERAVKGMLPKNKLGRQLFKRLHVYAGMTHPHQAQQPQVLKITQ